MAFRTTGSMRSSGRTGSTAEHFDIGATFPLQITPQAPQIRLMLQKMLADRFKLVLHKETRQLPMYTLVVAKGWAEDPRGGERRGQDNRQAGAF